MVQFSNNFMAEGEKQQTSPNILTVLLIKTAVNFAVILNTSIHLSMSLLFHLSWAVLDQ